MSRDLSEVIAEILLVVPESETSFIAALKDYQSSSTFSAPEMQEHWWREVAEAMEEHFPDHEDNFESWHKLVIGIWLLQ